MNRYRARLLRGRIDVSEDGDRCACRYNHFSQNLAQFTLVIQFFISTIWHTHLLDTVFFLDQTRKKLTKSGVYRLASNASEYLSSCSAFPQCVHFTYYFYLRCYRCTSII